jgi:hypothetical protein
VLALGHCSALFQNKVVVMLAEIFMVGLEVERRRGEEVLPSSTSSFILFIPSSHFVLKENGANGGEGLGKTDPRL